MITYSHRMRLSSSLNKKHCCKQFELFMFKKEGNACHALKSNFYALGKHFPRLWSYLTKIYRVVLQYKEWRFRKSLNLMFFTSLNFISNWKYDHFDPKKSNLTQNFKWIPDWHKCTILLWHLMHYSQKES